MATITQETRFDLLKHEAITLSTARDHVLSCASGELWITVDGVAGDTILAAGDSYRIDSNAPLVISAFRAGTVNVRHRQAFGPRATGARAMLVSLLQWEFPPLAAFASPLIR